MTDIFRIKEKQQEAKATFPVDVGLILI